MSIFLVQQFLISWSSTKFVFVETQQCCCLRRISSLLVKGDQLDPSLCGMHIYLLKDVIALPLHLPNVYMLTKHAYYIHKIITVHRTGPLWAGTGPLSYCLN